MTSIHSPAAPHPPLQQHFKSRSGHDMVSGGRRQQVKDKEKTRGTEGRSAAAVAEVDETVTDIEERRQTVFVICPQGPETLNYSQSLTLW